MKLVSVTSQDQEPVWDCFSWSATDFRPHCNGSLINVFTTIRPKATAEETELFASACTRELAAWILTERDRFNQKDGFQIVIAWAKDVRLTGRQILKTGGDFHQIEGIASGSTELQMHGNWTANVFKPINNE